MKRILLLCMICLITAGCLYKQPDDDYLHEIPTMNNPDITREQNSLGMPI